LALRRTYQSVPLVGFKPPNVTFGLRTHRVAAHPESLGSATKHTLYDTVPGTEGHVHVVEVVVDVAFGRTGVRETRLTAP
jgi:hypothetical protein